MGVRFWLNIVFCYPFTTECPCPQWSHHQSAWIAHNCIVHNSIYHVFFFRNMLQSACSTVTGYSLNARCFTAVQLKNTSVFFLVNFPVTVLLVKNMSKQKQARRCLLIVLQSPTLPALCLHIYVHTLNLIVERKIKNSQPKQVTRLG